MTLGHHSFLMLPQSFNDKFGNRYVSTTSGLGLSKKGSLFPYASLISNFRGDDGALQRNHRVICVDALPPKACNFAPTQAAIQNKQIERIKAVALCYVEQHVCLN